VCLLLTFNFPLALFVTCFLGVWVSKCVREDPVWICIPQRCNLIKNYEGIWTKQRRNRPASKKFQTGLIETRFSYYISSSLSHLLVLPMCKTLCLQLYSVCFSFIGISEFSGVVWRYNPCRAMCGVVLLFLRNILHPSLIASVARRAVPKRQ